MTAYTAYHQLGRFIVAFQHLEAAVNALLELTSGGDAEATRILINNLEYSKRLSTADVLFARFVDLKANTDQAERENSTSSWSSFGDLASAAMIWFILVITHGSISMETKAFFDVIPSCVAKRGKEKKWRKNYSQMRLTQT